MRSRTFLNVSLGILALAAAYHLGARSATAQAGSVVTGFSVNSNGASHYVMSQNGDVYYQGTGGGPGQYPGAPTYIGNFWGGATPTTQESFGSLKARYRGEREPQGAKPSTGR